MQKLLFVCAYCNIVPNIPNMFFTFPTFRMDSVSKALEEVLASALLQGCITIGVYESAKALNM